MRKRRLGRTGLDVSEIGLGGAWLLGEAGDLPLEHGIATVRRALELGINYLDTAECYIDGRSEAVLGAALDDYDGEYIIATKCGHRPDDFDFSRQHVVESARESVRLLGGRTIDVFQLHTPAEPPWERIFGPGGAVEGLRELRELGLCRFLGITGNDIEFVRRCIDTDVFDTVLTFMTYDILDQRGAAILEDAQAHDMGVIIGSPLRMGLFGETRDLRVAHVSDVERRQLERLEALFADEPGGITSAALRFVLASDAVSVMLSGAASPEQIAEVLTITATPLRPGIADEVRRISAAL